MVNLAVSKYIKPGEMREHKNENVAKDFAYIYTFLHAYIHIEIHACTHT